MVCDLNDMENILMQFYEICMLCYETKMKTLIIWYTMTFNKLRTKMSQIQKSSEQFEIK